MKENIEEVEKRVIRNCRIIYAMCRYIAHYRVWEIQFGGDTWGVSRSVTRETGDELCRLFPNLRWEDGADVHELVGQYVQYVEKDFHYEGLLPIESDRDSESVEKNLCLKRKDN